MLKENYRPLPRTVWGELLDGILDSHDIADDKADQQADEAGGGHVGKGTVREKQDHTHDDHDGGNDSTPEFPVT